MKISFVIPIFDEEENIAELYRRIRESLKKDFCDFDYEIIMIDDGSTDKSFEILKSLHQSDKRIRVIRFSRNFGHHIAITAGLDYVSGDIVVVMDSDLQDKPEEVIKLWEKMKQGYDVVYGKRRRKQFGFFKIICARLFNFIIKRLIDEKIEINSSIFRIMSRQVVESVRTLRESNRYIIGIIGWVGFKHTWQEVEHGERVRGKTKYGLWRQIRLASDAIFSFSTYFIKLAVKIGLFFVFVSGLLVIYIIIKKFVFHSPITGWTSIMVAILIVGGIQIMILGIIGEYVARIYSEAKRRPLYIISEFLD